MVCVLVLALGSAALVVLARGSGRDPRQPDRVDLALGQRQAVLACVRVRSFANMVTERPEISAEEALALLRSAAEAAHRAAVADPKWAPLSGGIASVAVGFDEDSPAAVRLGMQVVREHCADVGGLDAVP